VEDYYMINYDFLNKFKGNECTFGEMEYAFASATGDHVLNNISEKELFNNKSVSFRLNLDGNDNINVEFEIIEENKEDALNTIIKVTNIEII